MKNYNKAIALLVALGASTTALAHETEVKTLIQDDSKQVEKGAFDIQTQNIIRGLLQRGVLVFDESEKRIVIDLSRLTDEELEKCIKSKETDVDLEAGTVSLKPEFSAYLVKKNFLAPSEMQPLNQDFTDENLLEDLLNNTTPELTEELIRNMSHSFM